MSEEQVDKIVKKVEKVFPISQLKKDYFVRGPSDKLKYFFYFEAKNDQELSTYFQFLKDIEDQTEESNTTVMKIQVCAPNCQQKVSGLGNAYRNDFKELKWYEFDCIKNSHWIIKLKNVPKKNYNDEYVIGDFTTDELLEKIGDINPIYEDDDILIVYKYGLNHV